MSVSAIRRDVSLVGKSAALRALVDELEYAARSDAKVLITGETGVGKEVAATLIHERSGRSSAPFVTLNCAGLPDSLLESELFGYVRGSFTGAYRDKPGIFEAASHGTVLLDEVGEMSPRMQAVLLRFLESGEVQRIGADRPQGRVDIRLITATNRDLEAGIRSGGFREDLYFRLNVIRLSIPPLRARLEDIPLLVEHYLTVYSHQHRVPTPELDIEAMEALVTYQWPGNIRELRNVVERVVIRAPERAVRRDDLPEEITGLSVRRGNASAGAGGHAPASSPAGELVSLMVQDGKSFWSTVYPVFMARDLTRADLRAVVALGLEQTTGSYRGLVELFNMAPDDYKRFLSFLRKYDCHLPFQRFRAARASLHRDQRGRGHVQG